jgi:hypothetical protein
LVYWAIVTKQVCSKCKLEKDSQDFAWRYSGVKRLTACRSCHKTYHRSWYLRNDAVRREEIKAHQRERLALLRAMKDGPCSDCHGRFHFSAMDFDHVRGEKQITPVLMARQGWSLARIQAELEKCELVCSNCHRVRTHFRRANRGVGNASQPGFDPGIVRVQVSPPRPFPIESGP